MPFPTDKIHNWVRHNFLHGHCHICGLSLKQDVTGIMWSVEGRVLTGEPTTNWTTCKA